jgi:hypothetical protein
LTVRKTPRAGRAAERRGSSRVATTGVLRAHLSLEAEILYLSARGMLVRLPFSPEIGSRHGFTLVIRGEVIDLTGEVRNVAVQPADGNVAYHVGVEFVSLAAREQAILESFVAQKLQAP